MFVHPLYVWEELMVWCDCMYMYLCHLAIMFVPPLYIWEEMMVCSVFVCTCVTWLSCLCIPCTSRRRWWCVVWLYVHLYLCHMAIMFVHLLYVWEEMMVCSVIVCTCVTWLSCLCIPCTSKRRWWCVVWLYVLVSLGYPGRRWWCVVCLHVLYLCLILKHYLHKTQWSTRNIFGNNSITASKCSWSCGYTVDWK